MKAVLAVALVAVAIVAPYVIPGIIGVAAGSLAAIAVTAAVEIGVAVASSVLLGPAQPKIPNSLANGGVDRLFADLNPTAPRKIVFGHTAMATDVRYQNYTGANQQYMEQILCVASHKVDSIDELWIENEKAWSASGGVVSKYASFLTVDVRAEGNSSNGIAIDSTWTSTATMTGCAYIHAKYLLIHKASDGSNDSPFATGVPSRLTIRGKGALVYDPRLDSTVTGGSGSARADDQSTWAWDDNCSRNPALCLLFYLLGWKINDKLAVGMGLPPARIDLPSFITAANACDESVTLATTGTEPRYRTDGVITEGDDRRAVVEAICASMNAVMRDSGGKLSLTVLHDDLGSPITPTDRSAFDQTDILGDIQWDQTPDLDSIFNVERGRYIDASDNALYQPVDYPEVRLDSNDGIDRIDTNDYALVQSASQAQRLAKQRLQRNQYQGKIQFTGKPSFWKVSLGDVFPLTLSAFGWSEKLFRCAGQTIARTGETQIVAVEENSAIYAWDAEENPPVTAAAPTVYDPVANHPIQTGINGALTGTAVIDPINDVRIAADSSGTIKSGQLPLDVPITASNSDGDVTTTGTWARTTTTGVTCTMGSSTGVLNITAMAVAEAYVPISFTIAGVVRNGTVHIVRIDDAPTNSGSSGSTSASTSSLGDTTGSSYDTVNAVSAKLTCAAGAGGQVRCVANISYVRSAGVAPDVWGKWQWRVVSGTYADISTEVQDSSKPHLSGGHAVEGQLTVDQTVSSLTTGTDYEFRFLWRDDGFGNASFSSGVMTATGQ